MRKAYNMLDPNGLIVKWSTKTINVIGKTDASTSFNFPVNSFKLSPLYYINNPADTINALKENIIVLFKSCNNIIINSISRENKKIYAWMT